MLLGCTARTQVGTHPPISSSSVSTTPSSTFSRDLGCASSSIWASSDSPLSPNFERHRGIFNIVRVTENFRSGQPRPVPVPSAQSGVCPPHCLQTYSNFRMSLTLPAFTFTRIYALSDHVAGTLSSYSTRAVCVTRSTHPLLSRKPIVCIGTWHWHHWHDCRLMSLTVFCHITRGPCCAAFISFPLASGYWFGGSTRRATSGTHDEVCPRYCRDVCAQLLFSVLAIYSLDSSSSGPPLVVRPSNASNLCDHRFTISHSHSVELARVTGSLLIRRDVQTWPIASLCIACTPLSPPHLPALAPAFFPGQYQSPCFASR